MGQRKLSCVKWNFGDNEKDPNVNIVNIPLNVFITVSAMAGISMTLATQPTVYLLLLLLFSVKGIC
jgi:hypothetical protein